MVENTAKSNSPGRTQRVLQAKNYSYLSLERLKIPDALRRSSPCHVSTKHSQKAEWAQRYSQIEQNTWKFLT